MRKRFELLSFFDRHPGLFAGGLLLHTLAVVILVVVVMWR